MINFDLTNYPHNSIRCQLPERLDRIMTIRDVQNQELAHAIYVSTSAVSGWRNGRRMPDLQKVFFICCALQVSSDYLLGISDDDSVISPTTRSTAEEAG